MNKKILNSNKDFKRWYDKYDDTKIFCNENYIPKTFPCIILWTEYSEEAENFYGVRLGTVEYVDHEFVYLSEFHKRIK